MFKLNLTGTELVKRDVEVTTTSPKIGKLSDSYAEHAKIVYVEDVSGSMSGSIYATDPDAEEMSIAKMDLVRRMSKSEVEKRFKKFPDCNVAIVEFGAGAEVIVNNGTRAEIDAALDELNCYGTRSAGTDILAGIRHAMKACAKSPSSIGVHQFVIVSDGGDSGTHSLPEWMPALKASGVTMDYIHIGDEAYMNAPLKTACEELGGTAVAVNTIEDFKEKFLAASGRLMIEAPSSTIAL